MPTKKAVTKKSSPKKTAKKVAKKTTKKAATKTAKKSTRKRTNKQAERSLVYADNSTSFWVSDGQILNSLLSLRDALEAMDTGVYKYHATGDHNDFANWVEVVLCDGECAAALRKARTPNSARTAVVRHLKYYAY